MDERFRGLGVAMVTPFRSNGQIDYAGLEKLIDHQIKNGVDYVVTMGTTGESVTLTTAEKHELLAQTIGFVRTGDVAAGGSNTAEVIESLNSFEMDGVDAILSVSPYYNKPTQEGIYQHYKAIAQASLRPIILYNVPGRTGSNMTAETTLRLAKDFKNIIAIKEASGNLDQMARILKHRRKDFMLISGDDALTLPILALGGDGVISVVGNALTKEFSALVHAGLKGDMVAARKEHMRLIEVIDLLFVEGNPGGIKHVLKVLGICGDAMRLPLVNITEGTANRLYTALADAEVVKL